LQGHCWRAVSVAIPVAWHFRRCQCQDLAGRIAVVMEDWPWVWMAKEYSPEVASCTFGRRWRPYSRSNLAGIGVLLSSWFVAIPATVIERSRGKAESVALRPSVVMATAGFSRPLARSLAGQRRSRSRHGHPKLAVSRRSGIPLDRLRTGNRRCGNANCRAQTVCRKTSNRSN